MNFYRNQEGGSPQGHDEYYNEDEEASPTAGAQQKGQQQTTN